MAKVIDVENFLLIRDTNDVIRVFVFDSGIISRKLLNIVRKEPKIYFQCENDETFVGNNHPSYYRSPNDLMDDLKEILLTRNFQIIPWEKLQ